MSGCTFPCHEGWSGECRLLWGGVCGAKACDGELSTFPLHSLAYLRN
jgi:hypothetical protein